MFLTYAKSKRTNAYHFFFNMQTHQTHICRWELSQISNSGKRKMNYWSDYSFMPALLQRTSFSAPLPARFGDGNLIFTLQVLDANMIITGTFIYYSFHPHSYFQPLANYHVRYPRFQAILTYAVSLPLKEATSVAVAVPLALIRSVMFFFSNETNWM